MSLFSNILGIVPDNLENLKQLTTLRIDNSPIVNMTERLGKLHNLNALYLINCALTYLPDLSGNAALWYVTLSNNRLSKVNGLCNVAQLLLDSNLFTEIPTLNTSDGLYLLQMTNNPLKNMLKITLHVNLRYLYLDNTTLSSIPATIDRLKRLEVLYLSNNKLFYLPTNMLTLTKLRWVDIQSNLFSSDDIQAFRTQFNTSIPTMVLLT